MKRRLALLLAVVVLCALLFVAFGAEHDCTGENCQICCLLQTCLRLTFTAAVCALAALAALAAMSCMRICTRAAELCGCFTLITQKVKLSN